MQNPALLSFVNNNVEHLPLLHVKAEIHVKIISYHFLLLYKDVKLNLLEGYIMTN